MKTKTRYSDLSGWLKVAAITSWIAAAMVALGFIVGFIDGILSGW